MPPKKPPYSDMVDYAMHSAQGDKLSRTKIYDYLEALLPPYDSHRRHADHLHRFSRPLEQEFWQVDRTKKSAKERVNKALDDKVEEGILVKEKQSFVMTKKGERYYADRYKATDEVSSAEEEATTKTNMK